MGKFAEVGYPTFLNAMEEKLPQIHNFHCFQHPKSAKILKKFSEL